MSGHGTLLVGYDVESSGDPSVVSRFIARAEKVHSDLNAPCTFFIVGKVVKNNWRDLEGLQERSELFDYEQHTYSHMLLKTVLMDDGRERTMVRAGTPEQIEGEIAKTNRILRERLGVECRGLTGPWGYYRGLSDRPDLLEILDRNGIRFVRTWARNEKDYQPVSFEVQPFWYDVQGFPTIMEFPIQGWQDVHWRNVNGWGKTREYLSFLRATVDEVAEGNLIWDFGTHDWSSIREDPEMSIMRGLIEYARDSDMRIVDYGTFYDESVAARRT